MWVRCLDDVMLWELREFQLNRFDLFPINFIARHRRAILNLPLQQLMATLKRERDCTAYQFVQPSLVWCATFPIVNNNQAKRFSPPHTRSASACIRRLLTSRHVKRNCPWEMEKHGEKIGDQICSCELNLFESIAGDRRWIYSIFIRFQSMRRRQWRRQILHQIVCDASACRSAWRNSSSFCFHFRLCLRCNFNIVVVMDLIREARNVPRNSSILISFRVPMVTGRIPGGRNRTEKREWLAYVRLNWECSACSSMYFIRSKSKSTETSLIFDVYSIQFIWSRTFQWERAPYFGLWCVILRNGNKNWNVSAYSDVTQIHCPTETSHSE